MKADNSFAMTKVDEAKQLIAEQRFAEAAVLYEELNQEEPHHAGHLKGLALALHGCGKDEAAIPYAREAAKLHPVAGDNRYALGIALIGAGQDEEGVHELEMALTLQPHHTAAMKALGDEMIKLAKAASDAKTADNYLAKVVQLDPKRADIVAARIKIASGQGDSALAQRHRTEMHSHTGDDTRLNEALATIGVDHHTFALDGNNQDFVYEHATPADAPAEPEPAHPHGSHSSKSHPTGQSMSEDNPPGDHHLNPVDRAKKLLADGNYAESAKAFEALIIEEPHHAGHLKSLALSLHALGRNAEAIPYAREAAKLHPVAGDNRYALGMALVGDGKNEEGVHELEMAITLQPNHAGAIKALGDELIKLAKTAPDAASADANLAKIVRLDPKRADAVAARIKIALATNNLAMAQRHQEEMHRHTGDDTRLFEAMRAIGVDPAALSGADPTPQPVAAQPATSNAQGAAHHGGAAVAQPQMAHASAPQSHAQPQSQAPMHAPATGQSLTGNAAASTMTECPFCKQPILALAAVCPYCKLTIRAGAAQSSFNISDKPIWQEVAYNIMCWILVAYYGFSAAFGFGLFTGGVSSGQMTYGAVFDAAKVFLAVGLFFRNDIAATLMRWSLWLSIAWNLAGMVISLMMAWWIFFAIIVVKMGLECFMLYLINFEND